MKKIFYLEDFLPIIKWHPYEEWHPPKNLKFRFSKTEETWIEYTEEIQEEMEL